jgi:monoterpene epsilon-lactone hydrolase
VGRSAEAEKLNEILRGGPKAVEMTLSDQRAAGEHQEDLTSDPVDVSYEEVPELDGFWAIPDRVEPIGAVLYLYGGGYVISTPESRRKTAGHIAHASGARVLVPEYRLAPEHPFPAALDDASAVIAWLAENGFPSEKLIVAGGSSAGGLTVATMLKLKDDGSSLPAAAVVLSPWTDLACTGESLNHNNDLSVTKSALLRMASQYLAGRDSKNPLASPLYGDLAGLPPLLVIVGGDEALLDDSVRLVREAGIAGVDATLRIGAGMQHIYPVYAGFMPEADEAIAEIGAFIRTHLGG